MPLLDSNFALYAGTAAALGTGRTTVPTLIGLVDGFRARSTASAWTPPSTPSSPAGR